MAENLYPPIIVNVTTGAEAAIRLNYVGEDSQIAIRVISAIADVSSEIGYYETGTMVFSLLEKSFYKYSGTTWELFSDILATGSFIPTSAGVIAEPSFTDNNDGSCTIGSGTYNLYTVASGMSSLIPFVISGGTFSLTNMATNYIVANYNGGTPELQLISDVSLINETTIVPVFSIFRENNNLHTLGWDELGLSLSNKIHQSIVKTQRFRLQSGLMLSESATRVVNISSGIVWLGAHSLTPDTFDSSVDTLHLYYHSGGNWTSSVVTQYNNTQYDDGNDLVTLSTNKYAVNYVYRGLDEYHKEACIFLGGGNYTLLEAQGSLPPSNLPSWIYSHAILVGRIIVKHNEDTAYQIDSMFSAAFALSTTVNHNDLSGLQGGTSGEYYHLTLAQVNRVNGISPVTTISGNTTLNANHGVVLCNGTLTVSLPLASSVSGRIYRIKNIGTGLVTISATSIDGQSNQFLSSRYSSVDVVSDGSSWYIL